MCYTEKKSQLKSGAKGLMQIDEKLGLDFHQLVMMIANVTSLLKNSKRITQDANASKQHNEPAIP